MEQLTKVRRHEALYHCYARDDKLFGASPAAFRNRWNRLLDFFGVSHDATVHGLTPGSLRGSGATQAYLLTENIPLIAWRGRWQRTRTLEHYLQEVAAQLLLAELTEESRERIRAFASASDYLLSTRSRILRHTFGQNLGKSGAVVV